MIEPVPPASRPATRGDAVARALAALEALAALGEEVQDEWTYVTDLGAVGRARIAAAAGQPSDAFDPALGGAIAAVVDEVARISDPHRAIDWLSTFPAIVELALRAPGTPAGPTPPAAEPEELRVRFQDAARDARTVVYAGIQADPLVARLAGLAADASYPQRLMARAVMNGESSDPGTWRSIFPTVLGPGAPEPERAEALLSAALEVAGRGEQARSQFRGAFVEALSERLVARRLGSPAVRRERRILFDGVPAEIHPYDLTVELPGRAEAWDCKWGARGINADVLNQLDDARRNAAAEEATILVGLVVFDVKASCAVRLARQTAPRQGTRVVTLESLDLLAGRKAGA